MEVAEPLRMRQYAEAYKNADMILNEIQGELSGNMKNWFDVTEAKASGVINDTRVPEVLRKELAASLDTARVRLDSVAVLRCLQWLISAESTMKAAREEGNDDGRQ